MSDKLRLIESNNVTVNALIKNAVKTATSKERQHYSAVMLKEKKKRSTLSVQVQKEKELAQSFLDQKIAAERETRTATRQSNRSQMRSTDAGQKVADSQEEITTLRRENQEMADEMDKMESLLQDTRDKLKELRDASPIEEIKKERDTGTHGGGSSWPLYLWDLILEQLVNGTPPSAIWSNIVIHVKTFSPKTKIKGKLSRWTVLRARTVLLVIVQTLAAYRLAKSPYWLQLFTDATSRRQNTFQNLLISIEEDELFK